MTGGGRGIGKAIALGLADAGADLTPGYVATDLTENEELRASIEERTPLDRFAEPGEVAAPVVFLASDAAAYVTGSTLAVDGGWTAR